MRARHLHGRGPPDHEAPGAGSTRSRGWSGFLDEVARALGGYDSAGSGALAEWLGTGLQNLVHQFDSGRRLSDRRHCGETLEVLIVIRLRQCPLWPSFVGGLLFSDCSSRSRACRPSRLRPRPRRPAWSAARATSPQAFRGATSGSVPASSARSATRRTCGSDTSVPLPATSGGDEGPSLDQAVQDPGRERGAFPGVGLG